MSGLGFVCVMVCGAGPRLFLSCPMDVEGSRVWFTDLWNYSIIPYMLEAVREGLQVAAQAPWGGLFTLPHLSIHPSSYFPSPFHEKQKPIAFCLSYWKFN